MRSVLDWVKEITKLAERERIALIIIDGLGSAELELPLRKSKALSLVPSSTTPFLYSFFSHLTPAQHGFLAWHALVVELAPEPIEIPPFKTALSKRELNPGCELVFPFASPLSKLSNCAYVARFADTLFSRCAAGACERAVIQELSVDALPEAGLLILYWHRLDELAHKKGLGSEYKAELKRINAFLERALDTLDARTFVLSDHGLTACKKEIRLKRIANAWPLGDTRIAFFKNVEQREIERAISGDYCVLELKELLGSEPCERAERYYGELALIAGENSYFVFPWKKKPMLAHHGGLSKEERELYVWH